MYITRYILSMLRDTKRTLQAIYLKFKYKKTINRLKRKYGTSKITVGFCVSEIAKWKSQSLYDELSYTNAYRPIIYIYPCPLDFNQHTLDLLLEEKAVFFRTKKMEVVNIWDSATKKCIFPKNSFPDILFYQQPWDIPPFPSPIKVADSALSFYIPYYLVNNFNIDVEFKLLLHYQVFGYIVQNEEIAQFFSSFLTKRHYAGKCLGLGHTIVDYLTSDMSHTDGNSVIYAPHFSFPIEGVDRVLTYSTFLENGRLILDFAQQHPEIKWIFKPHPRLRQELENTGVWSKTEVDSYYDDWAKIGIVCMDSDYKEHFRNSFAMITDCGSFLTEYSCMDKPLIRLFYHKDNLPPNPMLEKLYDTFYYAHNNIELSNLLEIIVCKKLDPKQKERHKEVVNLGLNKYGSSTKIINYLDMLFSSK